VVPAGFVPGVPEGFQPAGEPGESVAVGGVEVAFGCSAPALVGPHHPRFSEASVMPLVLRRLGDPDPSPEESQLWAFADSWGSDFFCGESKVIRS
jgi:hypothetical protein